MKNFPHLTSDERKMVRDRAPMSSIHILADKLNRERGRVVEMRAALEAERAAHEETRHINVFIAQQLKGEIAALTKERDEARAAERRLAAWSVTNHDALRASEQRVATLTAQVEALKAALAEIASDTVPDFSLDFGDLSRLVESVQRIAVAALASVEKKGGG